MSAPRLEINLDSIHHNARTLVLRLASRGISVTGVTKATLGCGLIAREYLRAGMTGLGDSRNENIEALRRDGLTARMTLIRSPMLSQCDRVVASADVSLNTELDILAELSRAAVRRARHHGVVLMVELGDLREGILPGDVVDVARRALRLPNLTLLGIGANLACQSGTAPDARNMAELSELTARVEAASGRELEVVSGGNSANLAWALGPDPIGRVNNLRLGESVLLGCEPLHRRPIPELHTDAVTLVAEVIEAKRKPSLPWGTISQTAFGEATPAVDHGDRSRVIVAIGRQDVDPDGLALPTGYTLLGASSDHLVLDCGTVLPAVGAELRFGLDYSAVLRAMTSPFVSQVFAVDGREPSCAPASELRI